jgi:diguanylate cyclase (GGDEF)-like protein/PAS domain S-box-containing protein
MVIPAVWSLRRWHAPGARPFFALGIVAAAWALTEAGAQIAETSQWQIFFDKVSYVSAFTPLIALFLALDYRSRLDRLRPLQWLAIFSIPALTLLFALTNDSHHLIWTQYDSLRVNGIRLLNVKYGAWFWVFEIYATVSALAGTALLAQTLWSSNKLHRSQSALIAAGIFVSWVANTAYTFRLGPWPGLDLSPIGCAVCAVLCVLSLHRYRLFDLVPVAYDNLVQGLSDGVVVIDNQQRLIYANASASQALDLGDRDIGEVFRPRFNLTSLNTSLNPCEGVACEIERNGAARYFELSISPLPGRRWAGKSELGRVILLHDVTSKQVQQLALELSQDELVRSNNVLSTVNSELEHAVARSARLAEEAARAKNFVERILTTSPNIVYIYDLNLSSCVYVNPVIKSTLGHTAQSVIASNKWARVGLNWRDKPAIRQHLAQCRELKDGDIIEIEYRARHANGQWRWILSRHCVFTRDAAGKATQILGTASDITSRRHQELVVREQEERWQLALHGNSDGLWDWDIIKGVTYRSAGWKRMLGYEEFEIGSSAADWRMLAHPDDVVRVEFEVREHLDGKTAQFVSEYRLRAKDGGWRWVLDRGRCLRDDQGRAVRMAGSQTDINDRKLLEQRLATEARIDPLTGLPNRRHLIAELEEAFNNARREGTELSVAVGDIDRFKAINDTYGHAIGDRVLATFAELLRPCLRGGDFAGRLGGDEFCIFFPRSTAARARRALERVRSQLSEAVFSEAGRVPFSVSVSFGVAEMSLETESSRLLEAADRALYRAKQEGRNRTLEAVSVPVSPEVPISREAIN